MVFASTVAHRVTASTIALNLREEINSRQARPRNPSLQLPTSVMTTDLPSHIRFLYDPAQPRLQRKTGRLNPRGRRSVETCLLDIHVHSIVESLSIGLNIGKHHPGIAGQQSNSQLHSRSRRSAIISRNKTMCSYLGQPGKWCIAYPCHSSSDPIVHHCRCPTPRHFPHRPHRVPFPYLGNALARTGQPVHRLALQDYRQL